MHNNIKLDSNSPGAGGGYRPTIETFKWEDAEGLVDYDDTRDENPPDFDPFHDQILADDPLETPESLAVTEDIFRLQSPEIAGLNDKIRARIVDDLDVVEKAPESEIDPEFQAFLDDSEWSEIFDKKGIVEASVMDPAEGATTQSTDLKKLDRDSADTIQDSDDIRPPTARLCSYEEIYDAFCKYAGQYLNIHIDQHVRQTNQATLRELIGFLRRYPAALLAQTGIRHLCIVNDQSNPGNYKKDNTFVINLHDPQNLSAIYELQVKLFRTLLAKSPPDTLVWPIYLGNPETQGDYRLKTIQLARNLKLTDEDIATFLELHDEITGTMPVILFKSSSGKNIGNPSEAIVIDLDNPHKSRIIDQKYAMDERKRDRQVSDMSPAQTEVRLNKNTKKHGVKIFLGSDDFKKALDKVTEEEIQRLEDLLEKYGKQLRISGIERILLSTQPQKSSQKTTHPSNVLIINPTYNYSQLESTITQAARKGRSKWVWEADHDGKTRNLLIECSSTHKETVTNLEELTIFQSLSEHGDQLPPFVNHIVFTDDPRHINLAPGNPIMRSKYLQNIQTTGTIYIDRNFSDFGNQINQICTIYKENLQREQAAEKEKESPGLFGKAKAVGSKIKSAFKGLFS